MKAMFIEPAEFARQVLLLTSPEYQIANDPHLTPHWFQLLAETAMPDGTELILGRAGTCCFLPLMTRTDQPGRLLSLSNYYTPLFGLINESGAELSALASLASELRQSEAGFYEARFSPMDTGSNSYVVLREAFVNAGWKVDDYFCFGNWYYPVEGKNFQSYMAERPSRLRNTAERSARKLARTEGYSLSIVLGGAGLEVAIDDFVSVYNRSWKNPEPFVGFIPGLCRLAARLGWLRLGVVYLRGQAIASQLWLVANGKAHIVKLAYDEAFVKTSVGTVLTAAMIQHVIDTDAVNEIDYLMGDDAYKQDWMSKRRERRGLIAFNPRFARGLGAMIWHMGGKFKRSLRAKIVAPG